MTGLAPKASRKQDFTYHFTHIFHLPSLHHLCMKRKKTPYIMKKKAVLHHSTDKKIIQDQIILKQVCDSKYNKRFFVVQKYCRIQTFSLHFPSLLKGKASEWASCAWTLSCTNYCKMDPETLVKWHSVELPMHLLMFNRLWTISRELAVINTLFGQNNDSVVLQTLCYQVRNKYNTLSGVH